MGTDKNIKLHIVTDIKMAGPYDAWNAYIDSVISNSNGACDKVTLIGMSGGGNWTDPNHPKAVKLSPAQASVIATAMEKSDDVVFQEKGILLDSTKYQFLRRVDNAVLGKRKEEGCITIQNSKTCIVLAHTVEGQQQGNTNKAVDIIISYLEGNGM